MAKLYPPYIEGTLPAFYLDDGGDGKLTIPFAHNRAINTEAEISSFSIKVKSVQNDVFYGDASKGAHWDGGNEVWFEIKKVDDYSTIVDEDGNPIIKNLKIKIGQYYKIQLAYIDKRENVGYYSTVGVVKCTSEPTVEIDNFEENKVNNNSPEFIGIFKQDKNGDVNEKVYSSKFIITDLQGNEVFNSGDILHSIENNPNSYESQDTVYFNRDLNYGEIYKIQYIVTTTNGLVYSSPKYLLTQQKSIDMELKGDLITNLNYDEGFVDVSIEGALLDINIAYVDKDKKEKTASFPYKTPTKLDEAIKKLEKNKNTIVSSENSGEEITDGLFILSREDSLNPGVWEELTRFSLKHESPTRTVFRDFTIEQGKTYTYSLQQYNANNVYSDRKKSDPIYADFEDMFLYDGERQLKLRFNPQVTSFKTQLAETRAETIGNKYPFFFRNARVGYKTFPISGLVSMLSDNNKFFTSFKDILRTDYRYDRETTPATESLKIWPPAMDKDTDLVSRNFASERLFKLKVLDWLNDGHVKLFKSPGEGNYLVRLMDNSLSPNPQVGRMLHTVNSTAYECAEMSYKNLVENNIVREIHLSDEDTYVTSWMNFTIDDNFIKERVQLNPVTKFRGFKSAAAEKKPLDEINLLETTDVPGAYTTMLRFLDCLPGDKIRLVFDVSGDKNTDYVDITIGATGNYYADDIKPVYGIYFLSSIGFDEDSQYTRSGWPSITYQYNIPNRTTFRSIEKIEADVGGYNGFVGAISDLINYLSYTREVPTKLCFSRYFKRPVEYLYYASGDFVSEPIANKDNIFRYTVDENTGINKFLYDEETGYREMSAKYIRNLYWEIPSGGLSAESEEAENAVITVQKTLNENGLPDDWWEVGDWAKYYAIVAALLDDKDPETLTQEELENEYYPKGYLTDYRKMTNKDLYPNNNTIQAWLGDNYTMGLSQSNPAFVIWVNDIDRTWGTHLFSGCSHTYADALNGNLGATQVPQGGKVYLYKPTFPGEVPYEMNENGEIIISVRAYQKAKQENESDWFDDKESMEYSPYSLYVLRNEWLDIDNVKENIFKHYYRIDGDRNEATHMTNHLFEKYYIDRYLKAQTPEEMLEERSLLTKRYMDSNDEEEAAILEELTPLYVLDAWKGEIYKVDKDFIYDPSITYNEENIDLREIDRYELEDMEPSETSIIIGNGVYGDVFYQKVVQTFAYDPIEEKEIWLASVNNAKEAAVGYKEEEEERLRYKEYNNAIDIEREEWQKQKGEEE